MVSSLERPTFIHCQTQTFALLRESQLYTLVIVMNVTHCILYVSNRRAAHWEWVHMHMIHDRKGSNFISSSSKTLKKPSGHLFCGFDIQVLVALREPTKYCDKTYVCGRYIESMWKSWNRIPFKDPWNDQDFIKYDWSLQSKSARRAFSWC